MGERMSIFLRWLSAVAVLAPTWAAASCLTEVVGFSKEICGDIEKSGITAVVNAKGDVDVSISNIVRRVVGGGSAQLSGDALYKTYTNVLQEQLGPDRFNVLTCRQKMVDVAVKQVCTGSGEETKITANYVVCVGQLPERCPPNSVHLSCGSSVAEWAARECKSFGQTKLDDVAGNMCGYYTAQVTCIKSATTQ